MEGTMNATEANRNLIAGILAELEAGNSRPFVDALADDVRWITPGISGWARTYEGKPAVLHDLLGALRSQLVDRVRLTARRILADADHVVVEAKGRAMTRTGKPYNNDYCFIYRLAGGKITEVTEYLDTELVSAVLVPPSASPRPA
jgi:ketosteroid isomerase-like protein